MGKSNFDIDKYLLVNTRSIKDYITLIRTNLVIFSTISLIIIAAVIIYAFLSKNVYNSAVDLKINTQKQGILESQAMPELGGVINDRFIANEIEIINNYDSRERYAQALIDSFNNSKDKSIFYLLKESAEKSFNRHKSLKEITVLLTNVIKAEQLSGLDIIEISAESPSPHEAALIANTCANQYIKLNLESNRGQLSTIRKFLEEQSREKSVELGNAEENLKNFQQQGGIVALDAQSNALINQLATLDAQRDAAKVDILTSNEVLNQYKTEIGNKDPQLADYLESQASQTYIDALQKQIAELQMNKDLALSNKNSNVDVTSKIKDYDKKIVELRQKLNSMINDIKVGAYSSSPEQIRELTQKLIEEKVNNNSLLIKYNELQNIISEYEENFKKLPKTSIELAQFQRKRESMQQLYLLVEQKYQEALINELSQPGNAIIIAKGRIPDLPAKPNRVLIILIGIIIGLSFAFGYILIKDYFNETIQTPEDIEKQDLKILAWVPYIGHPIINSDNGGRLDYSKTNSILTESFKSIRARIQFSGNDLNKQFKTILVTSPAAQEGKTLVSFNLAKSFALSGKKSLLIDCDLIKPKIHTLMVIKKFPGLTDFLYKAVEFDEIINKYKIDNLYIITAGSNSKNTDEILNSEGMRIFLEKVREMFEIIIIDSAPIIPVVDSQILARKADGTVLVVSAEKTETKLMMDAVELLKTKDITLLGTVLNNFQYKSGYKYYYKYYYNYSSNGNHKKHKVDAQ